jgi:hypothetical protein
VLQLRVSGDVTRSVAVARTLREIPGARSVLRTEDADGGTALVTADLDTDAADPALDAMRALGVTSPDILLLRLESIGPSAHLEGITNVVWADLLSQAGNNARPLARYLVLMLIAGVIAAFGVIEQNSILIVGAMAVSPDILPITATCTGLVLRRWRLAWRAMATLQLGLVVTFAVAAVLTVVLDALGLLPDGFVIGEGGLQGLSTVNISTVFVALAAGVAGILALETRASAAVGVGEATKAAGALLVLVINVAMLIAGGSAALILQRRLARER